MASFLSAPLPKLIMNCRYLKPSNDKKPHRLCDIDLRRFPFRDNKHCIHLFYVFETSGFGAKANSHTAIFQHSHAIARVTDYITHFILNHSGNEIFTATEVTKLKMNEGGNIQRERVAIAGVLSPEHGCFR